MTTTRRGRRPGRNCHGGSRGQQHQSSAVTVALLGMPNTGKSTLYNRLTGGNAQIANWPGLTVELLRGAMPADRGGRAYQLVDLPGIHDLSGSSEDEAVVQRFLRHTPPRLLLVVLNATQIASQLRLLLQLKALALPMVAAQLQESKSRTFALLSLGWSLLLAWLMALVVFQGGRLLGLR